MNSPWLLYMVGIFFCIAGVYTFFKTAFEENQSIRWAVIIILMGVLLITAAAAKTFRLI
jgi:positive regulator of sigma E activity